MQEGSRTSAVGHTACQRSGRITTASSQACLLLLPHLWQHCPCSLVGMCWLLAVPAAAAPGLALLTDRTGGEAIFVLLLTCSEGTAEEQPMENNFVL